MALVAKHFLKKGDSSDLVDRMAKNVLQLAELLVLDVKQGSSSQDIQRRLSSMTGAMIQLEGYLESPEHEKRIT
ncbi:hypothetical protein CCB80_13895 [Armatimonadetes bacterium Uphvl-Ar1]|nr:hypothetical protein CCB80_13895 [Armatimonadetes bacterium Uphvl-Ar1]